MDPYFEVSQTGGYPVTHVTPKESVFCFGIFRFLDVHRVFNRSLQTTIEFGENTPYRLRTTFSESERPLLGRSSLFDWTIGPLNAWFSCCGNGIITQIGSMYGTFPNIYHTNHPNVGKYTVHGANGNGIDHFCQDGFDHLSFLAAYAYAISATQC